MGMQQSRVKSWGPGTTESQGNVSRRSIWPIEQGTFKEGEIGGTEASQQFTKEVLVRTSSGNEWEGKDSYNSCYEKETDMTW